MFEPFLHFLAAFRSSPPRGSSRRDLYALVHRLRNERRDLLTRIGEEVAVWHRAGGDTNQLLTEHLRDDLHTLGRIEETLQITLSSLTTENPGFPGEQMQPSGTMLEDADLSPIVIEPAPAPTSAI